MIDTKMSESISKRGRGRPRSFDVDHALECAQEVFWRQGYEGTSFADLTQVMGITAPSIVSAFGSKEDLYRKALDRYSKTRGAGTARALNEETSAFNAVARLLRESATAFTDPDSPAGCMISLAALACAPENEPASLAAATLRKRTLSAMEARLHRGVENGELPVGTNVNALARFFGSVLQGMSVQAIDGANEATLLAVAEMALGAWPGTRPPVV